MFEDYDDDSLLAILREQARKLGLKLPLEVAVAAVRMLGKERMKPNFGNVGEGVHCMKAYRISSLYLL